MGKILEFKQFAFLQNRGKTAHPMAELHLLLGSVPKDTGMGAKLRLEQLR